MKNYFIRKKYKKGFKYYDKQDNVISKKSIQKYLTFYIPPAYDDVQVDMNKNKVLAIGYDEKGRAQYIYDPIYTKKQSKNKFKKLISFGENYRKIYKQIESDLNLPDNTKNKQVAIILMIIIDCNFRIGNDKYTKDNNSYGVSTLEKRHLKRVKNDLIIEFIGKKGVKNTCSIKNNKIRRKLTEKKKYMNNNKDKLFTYEKDGEDHNVTANDVNDYLKELGNYSTKYFRTWNANIEFIKEIKKTKDLNKCIENVSLKLHHTPAICKKDYINSNLIEFYKKTPDKFLKFFNRNITKKFIEFLKK